MATTPPAKARTSAPAAVLEIDLAAIAANYRRLAERSAPGACAAVVKADAYGLGVEAVAQTLWDAGCRFFFTAQLEEALRLRAVLPDAEIAVLNGIASEDRRLSLENRIMPVLNSLAELSVWAAAERPGALLHLDTGMQRLGLDPRELDSLIDDPGLLDGIDCRAVMTHLACADRPGHTLNMTQLDRFRAAVSALPRLPTSIANSPGLFLGDAYRSDLSRPGAALFGVDTSPLQDAPMQPVIRFSARVLQIRDVQAGDSIGYGADFIAPAAMRTATIAIGYADGFIRALGNRAAAMLNDHRLPVIGRVSMDLTTLDITALPEAALAPGDYVDLLNETITVGEIAAQAGTIGYEVLTGLGKRFRRFYVDDRSGAPARASF